MDTNIENEMPKFILESMKTNSEFANREIIETIRQKNLWMIKIIAIANSIVGGFLLHRSNNNIFIKIALVILFVTTLISLIVIFRENKRIMDILAESLGKNIDYGIRALLVFSLSNQANLSIEDHELLKKSEKECTDFLKEIGILDSENNLGSVYKKICGNKRIEIINYVLIIALFIAIMIIIFSEDIMNMTGNNTTSNIIDQIVLYFQRIFR